jgi:hypothetical protein
MGRGFIDALSNGLFRLTAATISYQLAHPYTEKKTNLFSEEYSESHERAIRVLPLSCSH